MIIRRIQFACTAVLLAVGTHAADRDFNAWADHISAEWVRQSPQAATQTQYFSGAEQDALDRQLSMIGGWGDAYGAAAMNQRASLARRGLDELARFPRETLSPVQRTSAAVMKWAFERAIAAASFPRHAWVFDQFNGLQLEFVNFLTQTHPIRNRRDAENYLARLRLVGARLDEGITEARAAAREGFVPPRFILDRTIEQLDGFIATPPAQNVFVSTFETRVRELGATVSESERTAWLTQAKATVAGQVLPAFKRVRSLLADQLPVAANDAGIWRLARGADYYREQLARFTTTAMTADEIFALGEREVARIQSEMDKTFRTLGYTTGTIQERYAKLVDAMQPPATPDPRPMLLAEATRIVRDAEARAKLIFDLLPRAPIEVRREPAFSEKTAAAHYTDPAPDGSRPGIFWYPLPGPKFSLTTLRSLAYHEAVPGHHFQLAIQQEAADLPKFRKRGVFGFISAYGEGWALYAERLADENGWYEGDLKGRIGYLESMHYRAKRLVVDTGLHAKRWTREQVIDYGFGRQEAERYIVWPGQATSYMIGQLRIVELREQARTTLGSRFSIKEFHNVVLRVGNVPLSVLADEVAAWVAQRSGTIR